MTNLGAFDFIVTGTRDHQLSEPTPSHELLLELEYSNALFERRISFR